MNDDKIDKELKGIAEEFAEDIKKYVELGGKLESISATIVYTLIDKKENKDRK